ncbi:MAG TPA: type VI secretion protein IcmF/TssM N-terminal domain-containing protein [Pyrinomonadaceae bacterium]|nr:type VI secretion protein IcmF/TssM N-terminal domain-containing protein [Pyrinomonadaceae bacterium]
MSPTLFLILVLVVLLVVALSIFLYFVLRRARKVSFSPDAAMSGAADKKDQSPAEFLSYAANLELRSSFRRAIRLLRSYVTGRDYRYRVPWFLMTGESDSGKTTLLHGNGTNLSAEEGEEDNQHVNWYFFNEGVVIDVAGDFVLRNDGTANHRGWNTISRLLVKHRPRRPLDGVVLTIPAADLCGDDADLKNERRFKLEQKATCLYKKLWQSQRILGMRLPVYVLITKCDEVPGFTSFCAQLPDHLQAQMFGWSNDRTLETAYNPEMVPEAFTSLYQHLSALQFEIYTERDQIENADGIFLLPAAVESMRSSLQVYLDVIFKQSAYHEPFFFRGVYLCGEPPRELVLETAEEPAAEANWTEPFAIQAALPERTDYFERNPAFISDLFKEKIFAEDFLAQPVRRTALSRNRTVIAAQILLLLIIFGGGIGLAQAYYRMETQRQNLSQFLAVETRDLGTPRARTEIAAANNDARTSDSSSVLPAPAESPRPRFSDQAADEPVAEAPRVEAATIRSHGAASHLLEAMSKMSGRRYSSFFIPASWFSPINDRLQHVVTAGFSKVVFEDLRTDLLKQSDSLLIEGSVSPNRCARNDRNPRLPQFIEQLGELRANLDRYDTLVEKGSGSLENLNQLVVYLCHDPLPTGFDEDNELYQRALNEAHGKQIDTRPIFAEMVNGVGAQIEDLYEGSFDRRAVKYDKLDEIAEAEGLLRRPEYTWLATSVVDPHSQFHGMTISSALIDLRQALQDLRRQRFMAPAGFDTGSVSGADSVRFQHRQRSILVWDQENLRQAIAVYEQYQAFVETKSYDPWTRLDDSAKNAALNQVRTRISGILRDAQKYEPVPPGAEGSALRAGLVEEVRLLQEAQPLLNKVMQITAQLGIDRQLRSALYAQGSRLLGDIHREFVSQRFYVSKRSDRLDGRLAPDFSWWDGAQPVSYLTYDLGGKEELSAYLNIQRKNIAFLGRDLYIPVSTFFAAQKIQVAPSGQVDWVQILSDLDAYDNKTPGNPIAALENFIRSDMDRVSVDSCYGQTRTLDEGSSDYFLNVRDSLRAKFYERCVVLARIKAINDATEDLKNYATIEKSFNDNLAGGFPYGEVNAPPLDPWAMLKFFKVLADKEKTAREALDRSERFGTRPQAARDFLDQMDRARDFFAPFLEKKQGPAFDFKVQFRANRDQEIAANQIIDWQLEIGKKKFTYASDDLTGHWTYGEPIRLTLRWANDSPTRPLPSAAPIPFAVRNRSAVFEYNDRWSLFTFLLNHGLQLKRAGAAGDCDNGYDPDPYTLKFTIKTEIDPVAQPAQPNGLTPSSAEVFLRLTMLTANKPEPLMLPCLPIKAPPVPALFVSGTNTAENKD